MRYRSKTKNTLIRIGVLLASTGSALVAWFAAELSGLRLTLPGSARTVGAADVAVASMAASLAAMGAAALISRRSRRPRRTWTILATFVFVLSLSGPLTSGAGPDVVGTLMALHSIVAAVVIPQIRRTIPETGPARRTEPTPA